MIFDDVLRGLDADTENQIWHNLFGSDGLLRNHRTTVIFTSSAGK